MIHVRVRCRWWLRHYLAAVVLGCRITGMEPNPQRLDWWVRRGVVIESCRLRGVLAA